ncbi:terminase family protein [Oxalobacter vibrioformis]|uniref:Terminase family protein n=1 Tax=Oxalobacter vibrioformis TaxID=933080 RepID=A0A9E9LZW9_9BURK|nr:terminase family protein [Oxalobacter vibrioformis]WAW09908.1 terminase family protein [Oxalobacter vibrioformis]
MTTPPFLQKKPDYPVIWQPLPGSQTRFLSCPVFEALLEGTRGGGKTDALLMSFAQYCGRGFGENWRGALFRLTYPQLADVVAKSKRWFFSIFPGIRFNESDYRWTWPTGETLYFRYGATEDDYWNYHGHEYPWLGFEELTNWRDLTFFESMMSTCRSSFAGMPRMIRATCNPYGIGHTAVKERYRIGDVPPGKIIREEGQQPRVRIHSSIFENTHLLDADPDYLPTLEAIRDPNRRRAWLLGDWDIHIGSFLEGVWNPAEHVIDPFMIPSSWRVWKAMDWGYAAPYAVYWFAMDHDGVIYIWRELYGAGEKPGQGTRENAADVAKRIKVIEAHDERMGYEYRMNLADPSIFARNGADRSIGQIFRENGVRWQEAWNAKGSRVNGAQEIIRLLCENRLKVFRTCRHWLATVPSIAPDAINPEDVDTRANDHAWDATRYGIMRRRRSPDAVEHFIEDDIPDITVENTTHTFRV